jgi:hypothetical protein
MFCRANASSDIDSSDFAQPWLPASSDGDTLPGAMRISLSSDREHRHDYANDRYVALVL